MSLPRLHPLRLLLAACALSLGLLTGAGAASAAVTAANWNRSEQRDVVRTGVMSELPGIGFAGARPLTPAELREAFAALAPQPPAAPVAPPAPVAPAPPVAPVAPDRPVAPVAVGSSAPLTVTRFDALLVAQLGLGDVATTVQRQAAAAGLHPPAYFGSEVVARFLSLRHMQPTVHEALDLYPWQPITRAEAAHSFAVVLGFSGWELSQARAVLSTFALPRYSAAQRTVLALAVSKIGMPYVWGGTTDDTADGLPHGGYDCSGFAWRVYKVSGLPWGRQIPGRTAAQQAGEVSRAQRVRISSLAPGDLLFFGSAHFNSPATEANVIHEGIALSSGWVIHSSGQGVYVLPLSDSWLGSSFAWGRRVL